MSRAGRSNWDAIQIAKRRVGEGGDLRPCLVDILNRIDIAVGKGFLCIRIDAEDLFDDEEDDDYCDFFVGKDDDFEIDGKLSIISYALAEQYGYQVSISEDFCTLTIGWLQ